MNEKIGSSSMTNEQPKVEGWISTHSGAQFHFDEPVFDMQDIAHALSNQCRFNGHCHEFYSVAEHSVLVSDIMEHRGHDPIEGLLHDSMEAYIGDMVSPLKQNMTQYLDLEDVLDQKFRTEYNLPLQMTPECKEADRIAAILEGWELMQAASFNKWILMHNDELVDAAREYKKNGRLQPVGIEPRWAKAMFQERYDEIQEQAGED